MIENVAEDAVAALVLLFKRKDKTGGDRIVEHRYTKEANTLAIMYENEETAKRVVNFGSVTFLDTIYTAKYLSNQGAKSNAQNEISNAVVIEKVSEDIADLVKANFSREDEIEKHELNEDGELIIYYKTSEIAQRVLNFKPYVRKDRTFKAKPLVLRIKKETKKGNSSS